MHVFEDLVIPEVVDAGGRALPDGVVGDKLLVTVLFGRTLPLIRYELTDRVALAAGPCRCGCPFKLVASIDGRTDDALQLPSRSGALVRVHPIVFHHGLDDLAIEGWQVRQVDGRLRVLIARPREGLSADAVRARLDHALQAAGVGPVAVDVDVVDAIPSGAAGKRPLVVAAPRRARGRPSTRAVVWREGRGAGSASHATFAHRRRTPVTTNSRSSGTASSARQVLHGRLE
jgi:phenylacetate-coenzyme A ligase PaaK-like adenylate-forming protein